MNATDDSLLKRAEALVPELQKESANIEANRRVPSELSDRLGAAGFYRMLVPEAVGGLETHPLVFAQVLERLSMGDAAAAWVVMTGATTGLLLAYLDPSAAKEIVRQTGDAALAGVFAPMGRARTVEGGYRLSGQWAWASGCENARVRMGGALVMHHDSVGTLPDGSPEIRSMFFDAKDSKVLDTWRVMGLSGTGSHDVGVDDIFVPAERTTCVFRDEPRHAGPLYRFPIFGLLATGVSSVGLGIAQAALSRVIELSKSKRSRGGKKTLAEQELVQVQLATAAGDLAAARALVHSTLEAVWARAGADAGLTDLDRAELRLAATHAAEASARVVRAAYEVGGGASVWSESPLQRHFRDVHVMTQHVMVGQQTKKPIGRILLGLETRTADL